MAQEKAARLGCFFVACRYRCCLVVVLFTVLLVVAALALWVRLCGRGFVVLNVRRLRLGLRTLRLRTRFGPRQRLRRVNFHRTRRLCRWARCFEVLLRLTWLWTRTFLRCGRGRPNDFSGARLRLLRLHRTMFLAGDVCAHAFLRLRT